VVGVCQDREQQQGLHLDFFKMSDEEIGKYRKGQDRLARWLQWKDNREEKNS